MNLSTRGGNRGRGPSVPRYPGVRMYRDDFRRDNRSDDRRQNRFNNNDDEEGESYGGGGNNYYNNNRYRILGMFYIMFNVFNWKVELSFIRLKA